MTRKDYIAEANDIHLSLASKDIPVIWLMEYIVARCNTLEADNPTTRDDDGNVVRQGFDRERFIAAYLRGPKAEHRKGERA
jgi:hypothetical protein